MSTPSVAIDVRRVSFRYRPMDPLALDDVSAQVRAGTITTILGANGSGKSTLLHVLLGLLTPERGEIALFGRPLAVHTRRETSQLLGLVPQSEQVTFDLSVFEYALLGRAPYLDLLARPGARDRERAQSALEAAGIAALARRAVPALSGGERQLATVARALAQEPRILLLDEPTSHLDLANVRRVLDVLRSLRSAGRTIIMTTHDPNAAATLANDVLLMRQGRIVASGATDAVMTSERLSATYGVPVEVIRVHGRPLVLSHDPGRANESRSPDTHLADTGGV